MKLRKLILFTLFFASLFFFVACDKEERKEYYGNGALKSVTTYRDSVKDGQYISYYENGKGGNIKMTRKIVFGMYGTKMEN